MSLTSEERQVALDILLRSEQHLERLVADLNDAQWRFRPAPESWCIAEVVEHLVDLEERTLAAIERVLSEPPAASHEIERVKGKEQKLIEAVPNRNRRVMAPPDLKVTGRFAAPALGLEAFRPLRRLSIQMLERAGLHEHLFSHFVFRQMSSFQWLILLGAHAERHCRQIEEIVATEAFPT
jgi:hypothetical protein